MLTTITGNDVHWHARYCAFVRSVFTRAGFETWIARGDWGPEYLAFSWVDDGTILANVALTRMRLWLGGEEVLGWQLGAVAVHPRGRGKGLARILLEHALEHIGTAPALLFGNPGVREFYPRFGFAACEEVLFRAEASVRPSATPAAVLDLGNLDLRRWTQQVSEAALPASDAFGARGYGAILRWYVDNQFVPPPRQVSERCLAVVEQQGTHLVVHDFLSDGSVSLREALPHVIDAPISSLEFRFTPTRWWPTATAMVLEPPSELFVLRCPRAVDNKFPELAQT